jgi:hypothetical protein
VSAVELYADDDWTNEEKEELAQWFDQEGGVVTTINGYGLTIERAQATITGDRPMPKAIREAWKRIEGIDADVRRIKNWVNY